MKKLVIAFIWIMILTGLIMWLASCATVNGSASGVDVRIKFDPIDPNNCTITVKAEEVQIEAATFLKNFEINTSKGYMSTTAPEAEPIATGLLGFLGGLLVN